jgi:iron-sulfur cluster assembly protein
MIHLNPAAIDEVKRLRRKHKSTQAQILRLAVEPNGCAGWSYRMQFIPSPQPQDSLYTCGDLQFVVESAHLPFLDGLVLDYSEDLMGGGFRFHNPNATQTCGCGNSFAISIPADD